jgi:hypothetical protein
LDKTISVATGIQVSTATTAPRRIARPASPIIPNSFDRCAPIAPRARSAATRSRVAGENGARSSSRRVISVP